MQLTPLIYIFIYYLFTYLALLEYMVKVFYELQFGSLRINKQTTSSLVCK
jgi:hypothetical protein